MDTQGFLAIRAPGPGFGQNKPCPVRDRAGGEAELRWAYALATLPALMQLVQTRMRLDAPLTRALTA
jgi:hypothetical protein